MCSFDFLWRVNSLWLLRGWRPSQDSFALCLCGTLTTPPGVSLLYLRKFSLETWASRRKESMWHYACEITASPCIFDEWFFPGTTEMRIHSLWFCKVDLGWHFHKWNKLFMGTTQCSLVLYYEELNRLQYQVLNKINYPCKDVTFPRLVSHPC